jgi:hypothetical protein
MLPRRTSLKHNVPSQDGTSLEVLLLGEKLQLEPVSSTLTPPASAQRRNNKISAPTVPTAWLQHMYPFILDSKECPKEGTSLVVHVMRLKNPHSTMVSQTCTERFGNKGTLQTWPQHTHPSTVDRMKGPQEGISFVIHVVGE